MLRSALRSVRASHPEGIFLVLISVRGSGNPRAIVRLEGIVVLKKSNYLIEIRSRDLPAHSI
jgi:hypothetical protein